jgi:prefoldin subunit 5
MVKASIYFSKNQSCAVSVSVTVPIGPANVSVNVCMSDAIRILNEKAKKLNNWRTNWRRPVEPSPRILGSEWLEEAR